MLLSKSNVIDLSTVILSNWKLIVFNVYGLPKGSNHNVSILFLIVSAVPGLQYAITQAGVYPNVEPFAC